MKNCEDCKFFIETNKENETQFGVCRRNPPQILPIPRAEKAGDYQSAYPTVRGDFWCGEFLVNIAKIRTEEMQ